MFQTYNRSIYIAKSDCYGCFGHNFYTLVMSLKKETETYELTCY